MAKRGLLRPLGLCLAWCRLLKGRLLGKLFVLTVSFLSTGSLRARSSLDALDAVFGVVRLLSSLLQFLTDGLTTVMLGDGLLVPTCY